MTQSLAQLVAWFRHSSPFIHAHRDRTFVVGFDGEALIDAEAADALVHDLALLSGLGIRLVLVPGARPQVDERLARAGIEPRRANGLRITDATAMDGVRDAVGAVRLQLEALFSMGLANSPMAGLRLQVASGNFVTARPLGVLEGVDYAYTGTVRRVDADALRQRLDDRAVVIVSPLGVSPTGELFNLHAGDVAVAVARSLQADKLLFLHEGDGLVDGEGHRRGELTLDEARGLLASAEAEAMPEMIRQQLARAVAACRGGVPRVHLLPRRQDGAMLGELFTRDGVGTLVAARPFEQLRTAGTGDIPGILALIRPLEADGVLVARTRERLETEIDDFLVMEREGTIVACAALHGIDGGDGSPSGGEIACLVVHPEYRHSRRGEQLLEKLEKQARARGWRQLFVLTTQASHWFVERGYQPTDPEALPPARRADYQPDRASRVLAKALTPD
ncbi:UNVERIFIED_CONTAM: amino-acid N-acetyltransferase [Spiribacter pallidus]